MQKISRLGDACDPLFLVSPMRTGAIRTGAIRTGAIRAGAWPLAEPAEAGCDGWGK